MAQEVIGHEIGNSSSDSEDDEWDRNVVLRKTVVEEEMGESQWAASFPENHFHTYVTSFIPSVEDTLYELQTNTVFAEYMHMIRMHRAMGCAGLDANDPWFAELAVTPQQPQQDQDQEQPQQLLNPRVYRVDGEPISPRVALWRGPCSAHMRREVASPNKPTRASNGWPA